MYAIKGSSSSKRMTVLRLTIKCKTTGEIHADWALEMLLSALSI